MERHLATNGFAPGRGGMVRVRGDAAHYMSLQRSSSRLSFTVNLGLHFLFVPSFYTMRLVTADQFRLRDCLVSARIGHFLPESPGDLWWDADEMTDALLSELLDRGALVLQELAMQWGNAAALLDEFPPSVVAERVAVRVSQPGATSIPLLWQRSPLWLPDPFRMSVFLAYVAARQKQLSLAYAYANVAETQSAFEQDKVAFRESLSALYPLSSADS